FLEHLFERDEGRDSLQHELTIGSVAEHRPRGVNPPWSGTGWKAVALAGARTIEKPRGRNEVNSIDEFALLLIGDQDCAPCERCDAVGAAGAAEAPSLAAFVFADHGGIDVAVAIDLKRREDAVIDVADLREVGGVIHRPPLKCAIIGARTD